MCGERDRSSDVGRTQDVPAYIHYYQWQREFESIATLMQLIRKYIIIYFGKERLTVTVKGIHMYNSQTLDEAAASHTFSHCVTVSIRIVSM